MRRSAIVLLLLLATCGRTDTVEFGHQVRQDTGELGQRHRMIWGLDARGEITWSRMYDATISAAIEIDMIPDVAGHELVIATGRASLGRPEDASQLILLDRSGRERARCEPAALVAPPVASDNPLDEVHLRRFIDEARLDEGHCRGESVLLCGVVATSGWCLALALRYAEGRFIPVAAIWSLGTIHSGMAISDAWFGCGVTTAIPKQGPGKPKPIALVFTRVDPDGARPPLRLRIVPNFVGPVESVPRWRAFVLPPLGEEKGPNVCQELAVRQGHFVARVGEQRGFMGSLEIRPEERVWRASPDSRWPAAMREALKKIRIAGN